MTIDTSREAVELRLTRLRAAYEEFRAPYGHIAALITQAKLTETMMDALLARAEAAELELARAMSEIASLDGDCDRWHEKFRTAEAEVRQLKLTNENRRKLFEALLAERDAALAEVARLKTDRDNGAKDYCALMERHDALQVEVARLSTPPDDAEVAELVEDLLAGVPSCGMHEDNCTELFHVEDAGDTMALAAYALARLSNALAAETAKREGMEAAINGMVKILDRNNTKGPISDVELMFCWLAAQDARATLAKHGSKT